jgi:hypothetical protein
MTTRNQAERSLNHVLAGLVIVVTVVMGAMTHALAISQPFA